MTEYIAVDLATGHEVWNLPVGMNPDIMPPIAVSGDLLLTGRVPFEKDLDAAIIWAHVEETPTMPTMLRPELPPEIDEVFGRVLAKRPEERYGSCREFVAAARLALGYVAGQVHGDVWTWWVAIHHNIGFGCAAMNMGASPSPAAGGTSPSMGGTSPSMGSMSPSASESLSNMGG